jgi:hypothetical protein
MVRFPAGNHVDLDDYGAVEVVREFLAEFSRVDRSATK